MIAFAAIRNRIRTHLCTHTPVNAERLAVEGNVLAPFDGMWFRETFPEFTVEHPSQFSCRISGSAVYEILLPSDRDFTEAETIRQRIADLFLPPLLLSGDDFCIQTTRIAPLATTHESAWNITSVRIYFLAFPIETRWN